MLGFIGCGNMAQAMLKGILQKGLYQKDQIIVSRRNEEALAQIHRQLGVETTTDNRKVAEKADVLVLAVKPFQFESVIREIAEFVSMNKVVISIAAGQSIADIEGFFGKEIKLVRTMPNTPALVLEGATGMCFNELMQDEEKQMAINLFESFGIVEVVSENMIDTVIGVSGSSPAYVFMFIEAMADAAVAQGLPRNKAYTFAAQAVLGSAKMVLETGMHPGTLKDMVCSPGGTTIDAVCELERMGFRASVESAMRVCGEKSKKMTEGK